MIEYNLVRSNRKSMAIHITKEAIVEVLVPLKMSFADIDKFVLAKEKWIQEHISIRQEKNIAKADFKLKIGDKVTFRGKEYPIGERYGNKIYFDGDFFYVPELLDDDEIKDAIIQMYQVLAKKLLPYKTMEYAKQMGVTPKAVKINSAKTHWGSCSANKNINFSWMLVIADDELIDYIIVHELAHLKELNHSGRFWSIVEAVLPDYKLRQKKLKLLQEKLSKEDWN